MWVCQTEKPKELILNIFINFLTHLSPSLITNMSDLYKQMKCRHKSIASINQKCKIVRIADQKAVVIDPLTKNQRKPAGALASTVSPFHRITRFTWTKLNIPLIKANSSHAFHRSQQFLPSFNGKLPAFSFF